jgi:hypothetical protein
MSKNVPAYLHTSGNWIFRPTARGRADPAPPPDLNLTFTKFQTPGTVVKVTVLHVVAHRNGPRKTHLIIELMIQLGINLSAKL